MAVRQSIALTALVVREYGEAIAFYVGTLGFSLVEDTYLPEQDKRWVVVSPPGAVESRLLLARALGDVQSRRIGNQTGGRVFLCLETDDFWRDFHAYEAKGVTFVREPKQEHYGTVAVFRDLYGNLWDLVERRTSSSASSSARRSRSGQCILPTHACVVANLHDRLVGVSGERVETVLAIEARGRVR